LAQSLTPISLSIMLMDTLWLLLSFQSTLLQPTLELRELYKSLDKNLEMIPQ